MNAEFICKTVSGITFKDLLYIYIYTQIMKEIAKYIMKDIYYEKEVDRL